MVFINIFLYFFLSQRDKFIECFRISNVELQRSSYFQVIVLKIYFNVPIAGSFLLIHTFQKSLSLGDVMYVNRVLL